MFHSFRLIFVPFLSAAVTWLDSFPTHLVLHVPSVPVDRDGVIRIFAVSIDDDASEKNNLVFKTFSSPGNEFKEKRTILSKRKKTMFLQKDGLFRVLTHGTSTIANTFRLQKEKREPVFSIMVIKVELLKSVTRFASNMVTRMQ